MGMSTGKRGGLQAEINVTPLIDVLLVLLIIFLVVMPIMVTQETLAIPREADAVTDPEPSVTVLVKPDLSMELSDGESEQPIPVLAADLSATLRPHLTKMRGTKVVFVDFDPAVPWREAVAALDSIRSLSSDRDHDEVRVALKVKPVDAAH